MGTSIDYIMWTTNDYIFWTLDDEVLDKNKNPHWNYEQELPAQQSVDEFGNPITTPEETVPGNNHFKSPQMPYVFLSIFSLGKQPHDETNLIQQNIPLQDLVNKRLEQIDVNADRSNNSIAMSGDAFTEEQAQKFGKTRRKGGIAWVPTGPIDAAVKDLGAPALPTFIYESLIDYRNEIRNIFGTRGSSPQGTIKESTLGGKQIIKGQDADRIGGGISTYLEEFSDRVYNWYVQLMYVYYDELHSAAVLGKEKAQEYITLVNSEFTSKLTVGVKEGSMIPHDPENKRMEAVELYKIGAMDPITLGERLEMPNPREFAKALYLWKADPIALFPDLQQAQQEQMMMQQQEQEQTMMAQKQDQKTGDEDKHERELQKSMFNNLTKQQI